MNLITEKIESKIHLDDLSREIEVKTRTPYVLGKIKQEDKIFHHRVLEQYSKDVSIDKN